jgi:hypothetical protein
MFISPAMAGHFMADDGNTGGGNTLLIILGVGLVLAVIYFGNPRNHEVTAAGRTLANPLKTTSREVSEPPSHCDRQFPCWR